MFKRVNKLPLPIPKLKNSRFDVAKKYEDQGLHRRLYTWSDTCYKEIGQIWKGTHPEDGSQLEVIEGMPEGFPVPDLPAVEEEFAPGISAEDFAQILERLKQAGNIH